MSELKPCPFCGEFPEIEHQPAGIDCTGEPSEELWATVHRCHADALVVEYTKEDLIAAWNTRAAPALPEGAVGQETLVWWPMSVKPKNYSRVFLKNKRGFIDFDSQYAPPEQGKQLPPKHTGFFTSYAPVLVQHLSRLTEWAYAPKGPKESKE